MNSHSIRGTGASDQRSGILLNGDMRASACQALRSQLRIRAAHSVAVRVEIETLDVQEDSTNTVYYFNNRAVSLKRARDDDDGDDEYERSVRGQLLQHPETVDLS